MVYSSCEFQSSVHNAAGVSKTRQLPGVYQNFFWDVHETCHTSLATVLIAWALVSHVLPEWNSLFVDTRWRVRSNQGCFCLLVTSSSRVRHSCSWLSLHTVDIQTLFGRLCGICMLQCDKEYTVLLSWLSYRHSDFLVFVFSLNPVFKPAHFLILDK